MEDVRLVLYLMLRTTAGFLPTILQEYCLCFIFDFLLTVLQIHNIV